MLDFPWLQDPLRRLEGRLLRGQVPQALLIHGPAGIGRRHFAVEVAARLLQYPLPGLTSASPDDLLASHPDFWLLQPEEDETAIRIAQVREFNASLSLTSHRGGHRVGMIFPAEAMTIEAANGLLKTLEEPPARATIVLICAAPSRLPGTILSRCERVRLVPPGRAEALAWLGAENPDASRCARALAFTSGAPLAALAYLGDDAARTLAALDDDLQQLIKRQDPPTTIARRWAKLDAGICIRWLYLQVANLIRGEPGVIPPLINPGRQLNMVACCEYLDQLIQAQRLKDRSLNMEAMFAELLMWWYGATGATR